jgi:phosphatidylinositol phospholipase C delta
VEVDVHERGSELIVKHGFTATASILFVDVITAIADFSNQHQDHWPIILSLEVHLGPEGREQMAEILLDKFGNKIFLIEKGFKHFPPPLRLKNKIIIKTDCKLDPNLSL